MAVLLEVPRLCCLVFYICGIHVYVSTQSIQFTEPTKFSPDCSFRNALGKLRECNVQQIALSLPTNLSCSSLLPNQFFTNEEKDMPPRLDIGDVKRMFTQSSVNDLKVKIDVEISEPNHDRLNGVFFEIYVFGNIDRTYDTQYCFLLDFNGTLKRNDIISSYANGGDLTLSFCPTIDASKSADYVVVVYPLPFTTEKMNAPRKNYRYSFSWFQWQLGKCKKDFKKYLVNSELKMYEGRLEFKINSSSLFNYNCPLSFILLELNTNEKKTVHFNNGVAVASNIEQGKYKMKFTLQFTLYRMIEYKSSLRYPFDVGVTFQGKCLSFPCGTSVICQQHGKKKYKCSCPPDQILKGNKCYNINPCNSNPCGHNGLCIVVESDSDIDYFCDCNSGFIIAQNTTCMPNPCNNNPCIQNRTCRVIKSDSGFHHSCDCMSGFFMAQDMTCIPNPCYDNPCSSNSICSVVESDEGIQYSCDCNFGFFMTQNMTCKPDPCLDNPCGNGTCTVDETLKSNFECKCFVGFYATQDTCRNLQEKNVVLYVLVGLAGCFLIARGLYVRIHCHSNGKDLKAATSFDKIMLEQLKESGSSAPSSIHSSTSERVSEEEEPLQPVRCGSQCHPGPSSVLMSNLPNDQCHENNRLSCTIHQQQHQEVWPRASEVENYPWREEDTFSSHSPVPYSRDISIDSQLWTSNHTSV